MARSAGMLAALENGGCVVAGHLPDLEAAMVGWQPGAHQPDAVAASVIGFDVLSRSAGGRCVIAAPVGVAGGTAPAGGGGGFGDRLGSRRPLVDALVAEAAARAETDAADAEPDTEPGDAEPGAVTSMSDYLARRSRLTRRVGGRSTPFGAGYDPLAGRRFR